MPRGVIAQKSSRRPAAMATPGIVIAVLLNDTSLSALGARRPCVFFLARRLALMRPISHFGFFLFTQFCLGGARVHVVELPSVCGGEGHVSAHFQDKTLKCRSFCAIVCFFGNCLFLCAIVQKNHLGNCRKLPFPQLHKRTVYAAKVVPVRVCASGSVAQ